MMIISTEMINLLLSLITNTPNLWVNSLTKLKKLNWNTEDKPSKKKKELAGVSILGKRVAVDFLYTGYVDVSTL